MSNTTPNTLLNQEWQVLHQDHERYDRYGLIIKLTAVLTCLIALGLNTELWLSWVFICVLWLQEGIWRTVQGRTSERLLAIEENLKSNGDQPGMQFYSEWEANRGGTVDLVKEYVVNAVRPTVAYPYVILIGVTLAVAFLR